MTACSKNKTDASGQPQNNNSEQKEIHSTYEAITTSNNNSNWIKIFKEKYTKQKAEEKSFLLSNNKYVVQKRNNLYLLDKKTTKKLFY